MVLAWLICGFLVSVFLLSFILAITSHLIPPLRFLHLRVVLFLSFICFPLTRPTPSSSLIPIPPPAVLVRRSGPHPLPSARTTHTSPLTWLLASSLYLLNDLSYPPSILFLLYLLLAFGSHSLNTREHRPAPPKWIWYPVLSVFSSIVGAVVAFGWWICLSDYFLSIYLGVYRVLLLDGLISRFLQFKTVLTKSEFDISDCWSVELSTIQTFDSLIVQSASITGNNFA